MSTHNGNTPFNLEQQRKRAKDLLKAARAENPDAMARLQKIQPSAEAFKLADAQLAIAREAGLESWPKLVEALEHANVQSFKNAIHAGDAKTLRRLLSASPDLRSKINAPIFAFGGRPINAGASHLAVIDVLQEFGADINLRSDWNNGPFGLLDSCPPRLARPLLARGAQLTAHAAARFGWLKELRKIVNANPAVIHEKGGDGQRPLHHAKTRAIAGFLLDRGADINARCVDHHSTAAQYALKDRPAVTKYLLKHDTLPDIFMSARLGDRALARRLIEQDPQCVAARTHLHGYAPVPVLGIYNWVLGFHLAPHDVALQFGHREVYDLLMQHSPPKIRFLVAAMNHDRAAARQALQSDISLPKALSESDHSLIAYAAFHNKTQVVTLMLDLGFDPNARGTDGGTVLHAAAWVGSLAMIDALLKRDVNINAPDPTHGSPPLGWAAYGSVHAGTKDGDYVSVIERLVRAGADIKAPGNKYGMSMFGMAQGKPDIQNLLRKLGAR